MYVQQSPPRLVTRASTYLSPLQKNAKHKANIFINAFIYQADLLYAELKKVAFVGAQNPIKQIDAKPAEEITQGRLVDVLEKTYIKLVREHYCHDKRLVQDEEYIKKRASALVQLYLARKEQKKTCCCVML